MWMWVWSYCHELVYIASDISKAPLETFVSNNWLMTFEFLSYCIYPLTRIELWFFAGSRRRGRGTGTGPKPLLPSWWDRFSYFNFKRRVSWDRYFFQSQTSLIIFLCGHSSFLLCYLNRNFFLLLWNFVVILALLLVKKPYTEVQSSCVSLFPNWQRLILYPWHIQYLKVTKSTFTVWHGLAYKIIHFVKTVRLCQ